MIHPNKYSILIISVLLIAESCDHHGPKAKKDIFEEKVPEKTIEPVQSDSCLLGEKMINGRLRKENFSTAKNVSKQNVNELYSNYNVTMINDSIYKIVPKKLYEDARYFTRIILFGKNGAQKNAITFNDYDLPNMIPCKEGYVVGLNSLFVGSKLSPSNYSCKIVMIDKNFKQLWERQEPNQAYYTFISSIETGKYYSIRINFQGDDLDETSKGSYSIDLDKNGKIKQVRIDAQPTAFKIQLDSLKKREGLK